MGGGSRRVKDGPGVTGGKGERGRAMHLMWEINRRFYFTGVYTSLCLFVCNGLCVLTCTCGSAYLRLIIGCLFRKNESPISSIVTGLPVLSVRVIYTQDTCKDHVHLLPSFWQLVPSGPICLDRPRLAIVCERRTTIPPPPIQIRNGGRSSWEDNRTTGHQ